MDGGQPTTSQTGGAKKAPIDGLSKEELIKKCKGLLVLAQKAKQSKDEFAEENKILKEELNKFETQKDADKKSLLAMKEMVDALTDNKLAQTIQITDMDMKITKYQKNILILTEKCRGFEEMSIENESLTRQVQRLADENEELLSNLDSMEKKLHQVNQFGMQQQKDLTFLEEATAKWESLEAEWKNKLDKMEKENDKLIKIIEAANSKQTAEKLYITSKLESELELLQQRNVTLQKKIENSVKEYDDLLQKYKQYEEMCTKQAKELDTFQKNFESTLKLEDELKVIRQKNETLRESVQNSGKAYDDLLQKCKGYVEICSKLADEVDCIQKISEGTPKLEAEMKLIQQENEMLRKRIDNSSKDYDDLLEKCKNYEEIFTKQSEDLDNFQKTAESTSKIETELKLMREENQMLHKSVENWSKDYDNLLEKSKNYEEMFTKQTEELTDLQKTAEIAAKLEAKLKFMQDENETLRSTFENSSKDRNDLFNKCKSYEETSAKMVEELGSLQKILEAYKKNLDEMKKENDELKQIIEVGNSKIEAEKSDIVAKLENDLKLLHQENEKLRQSIKNSSKEYDDLLKKCKNYEEMYVKQVEELSSFRKTSEIQHARLQNIKIKLTEVTMKLKKLKKSKMVLADAVQEYYVAIPKWQQEVQKASEKLCIHISTLDKAKRNLQDQICIMENKLQLLKRSNVFYRKRLEDLVDCCNKVICEEDNKNTKTVALSDACTVTEEKVEVGKFQELEELLKKSSEELKQSSEALEAMRASRDSLQHNLKLSTRDKVFFEQKLLDLIECCNKVQSEEKNKDDNDCYLQLQKLREWLHKAKEDYEKSQKHLSTMQEDFNKQSIMLENAKKELEALRCEKSDEMRTESDVEEVQIKLRLAEKDLLSSTEENELLRSRLALKETENADLLAEMRELIEALKCRGDAISRQQDKISELEKKLKIANEKQSKAAMHLTEKDEVIAQKNTEITKITKEIYDAKKQVRENEQIIKNLTDEMASIRDRVTDMQSDVLSTSTMSKADESSRMREVDECFEEKYNKLRSLAIKLKKKVQEQANQISMLESDKRKNFDEKNEIRTKLGSINLQVKNLQALQNENDKLLDEIEKIKKEKSNAEKQIKDLADKIKNLSDSGVSSKQKTENVIQEYQNQIKALKQEKDSFNLIKKEWEKERDNFKGEIINKDREISALRQEIDKNKIELERCKAAGKQSSVLNLEIEAYEKSLNDATQNLKTKETLIKDLHESIKNKNESLESIKKEVKLLEESLESERTHSSELKQQMDVQQKKFKESEHEKSKLREHLQDLTSESESLKSQVDELRLQLSELISEKDKMIKTFQKEKETLYRQVVSLEESLANTTAKLKTTECEVEDVKTEYANYKVRAQSILRQNQTKETSRERELEEEITAMRSTVETLNLEITAGKEATAASERKIEEFRQDNERILKRCKELMQLLEEARLQNEAVLEDNRKQSREYQESLKSHRLQIDAINSCYKKQVEELEKKHAIEFDELKKVDINATKESRLVSRVAPFGGPKTSDEQKIDLILMEREDAEGSEMSVPLPKRRISSTRSKHDMIPLDELLNSSLEDQLREDDRPESPTMELQLVREKLQMHESRVRHLTSLLSETEQDLARLTQLNEVLKEEVRRHERAVEREQHIQNSEYLKNVVLKFLTLASGDERSRLVPVLNTILKLSPEETQTLQNVSKGGDLIQRGWGSYLPIWSNHQ